MCNRGRRNKKNNIDDVDGGDTINKAKDITLELVFSKALVHKSRNS